MLMRRVLLSGQSLTRARRVPNPYSHVSKVNEVYGKYSKYFEEVESSVAKYTDKCACFTPRFSFSTLSPFPHFLRLFFCH